MALPSGLTNFLQHHRGNFTDATLVCEGKKFPINKVVLAAGSEFLLSLFSDPHGWGDGGPEFHLPGLTSCGLGRVLDYLYGRPPTLSLASVWDTVEAADFLGVSAATSACTTFLLGRLRPGNVLGIRALAGRFRLAEVEAACRGLVLARLPEVAAEPEFLALEFPELRCLLEDDRVAAQESEVWRAALAWLAGPLAGWPAGPPGRDLFLQPLLATVRLGLLDRQFFLQHVATERRVPPELLQEAGQYLSTMAAPTRQGLASLRAAYTATPTFALPRLPTEFLFTLGGFQDGPLCEIEVYDSASDRWMKLEIELPRGLVYCAAEAVAGRLYVMGGVLAGGVPSRRMEVIDLDRQTVGSGAALLEPRIFATSAVMGSSIFLFGGRSTLGAADTRLSSCERLDTTRRPPAWEAARPMPEERSDAGAAVVRSRIFLAGGFSGLQALSSVVAYSPAEDAWQSAPGLAEARAGPGCAALGSTLYVAGGTDSWGSRLSSVERLEAGGAAWEAVASMRHPRSNFRLVAVGGRLLAVGGYSGSGVMASVECYHPERNLWREVAGLPRPKSGLATAVVPRAQLATPGSFQFGQREELLEQNITRLERQLDDSYCKEISHEEEGSGSSSSSSDE